MIFRIGSMSLGRPLCCFLIPSPSLVKLVYYQTLLPCAKGSIIPCEKYAFQNFIEEKLMTEQFTPPTSEWYHPTDDVIANAHIPDYEEVYKESMADIEAFWAERANELEWYKSWDKVLDDS